MTSNVISVRARRNIFCKNPKRKKKSPKHTMQRHMPGPLLALAVLVQVVSCAEVRVLEDEGAEAAATMRAVARAQSDLKKVSACHFVAIHTATPMDGM